MLPPRDTPGAFEAHLAARLEDAAPKDSAAAWLAVEAGPCHYLFPLGDTGEIFPWTVPQPVPHTVAWFLGVANLRGGLYGVASLRAFADADPPTGAQAASDAPARPAAAPAPGQSRLVALHARFEINCSLQVDRVIGLRGAEVFLPAPGDGSEPLAATTGGAPAWRTRAYVDAAGTRWQALDLQALARHPRFLDIGA